MDSIEFATQSHGYRIAVNPVSLFAVDTTIDHVLRARVGSDNYTNAADSANWVCKPHR
jgi:hypothetical protein